MNQLAIKIDAWGYDWLSHNHPGWVDEIERLVTAGQSPDAIRLFVLRETQSADLARFCAQAARHARRVE